MKIQTQGAAMNPSTSQTELSPSTQLRKTVFGGSHTQYLLVLLTSVAAGSSVFGQQTFIYDQQSAIEGARAESFGIITTSQPFGQSFTPTLDSVGFIRLWVYDLHLGNSTGSTISVNLRMDAITGAVFAATAPISLPDDFSGYPDFFFASPVSVTPGVTYYFQPVLQSGDAVAVFGDNTYGYAGGNMFVQGESRLGLDVWFREGIVVPEPSSAWLVLVGSGVWFYAHRLLSRK